MTNIQGILSFGLKDNSVYVHARFGSVFSLNIVSKRYRLIRKIIEILFYM